MINQGTHKHTINSILFEEKHKLIIITLILKDIIFYLKKTKDSIFNVQKVDQHSRAHILN